MSRLYDRDRELISTEGIALLAGVDVETVRQAIPDQDRWRGELTPFLLPAPLFARMLANVDRIDPDRTADLFTVIDRLAEENKR